MVFALLIPAERQSLASWVQLKVCDSLFEELIYWSGYPEYNYFRTRAQLRHLKVTAVHVPHEAVW